ncbi:MAG TPA: tRNA uridine-5-carboxymethylaminomethyl(34) synthesis enzyme MnmG [Bacteroidia bacterium]|nr:tRNA uridine-5-carboxymethylaminomethyl(34) synthesis enzyme MnmG [Bacteroidia bacterium]
MEPLNIFSSKYDVIVVGAGHAGCEAAAAAANMGSKVLLVTMNMQTIAQMSCNPAMGGIAKGQIVREIDALGGLSGIISDKSTIQFRMLNRSKGPAMWSPRTQNDRMRFAEEWRSALENISNIDFWQEMVCAIIVEKGKCKGIETSMGLKFYSNTVVLTNGTFLNGVIHIGKKQFGGGRSGERASKGITEQLVELGFTNGRMKTGTPPRLDGRTIDYNKLEEQSGDENPSKFSFTDTAAVENQLSCHITYTSNEVHALLKEGFEDSPMFSGSITGSGPRYCPSIEDKINRFAERDRHQLFVEPEGRNTVEVYLNGFSTSLAEDVQLRALRKIEGLEKVKMFRPGYAIEYDYFPPDQLKLSLETKKIENLYFAGQINGTTGYEEAACQGLMAGINAHLKCQEKEEFILKRSEAYIGVLIDDLVSKGTDEPYRMFTSRAEFRSLLRQDNADLRLTEKSYHLGLANNSRLTRVLDKKSKSEELRTFLKEKSLAPDAQINNRLEQLDTGILGQKTKMHNLLLRPQIDLSILRTLSSELNSFIESMQYDSEILEQTEVSIKYEGYIEKEQEMVDKMNRLENIKLNPEYDYSILNSLSTEARQKLNKYKPINIGQASRISGVSPADISILLVHLGR